MRTGFDRKLLSWRSIPMLALFVVSTLVTSGHARADDTARASTPPADAFRAFPLTPDAARSLVSAALRASGLMTHDASMDALSSRARASGWLPELRLRAERTDESLMSVLLADPTRPYEISGFRVTYEARLSWKLDKLLYSGDEPQIEHLRIERIEARERLAHRTLEAFFMLERELAELARATAGTLDAQEHGLRAFEAAATLDVLTGGWFSDALRGRASPHGGSGYADAQ